MAFEWARTTQSIIVGKDFVPIVEDFVHMAFDFASTVGYLACREDSSLDSLEIVEPKVVDKKHTVKTLLSILSLDI